MSEAEKKRRAEYKQNRKRWIIIQAIVIAVVSTILLSSVLVYYRINKTYYIDYTESSNVDYSVQLAPNDFYDKEWISKDKAYISSLIEDVMAKFLYELDMDASDGIEYTYSYWIDATLRITDKYTGTVIYEPVTEIVPMQSHKQSGGQKLTIKETVLVDYDEYNDKAISFNNTYKLKDSSCALVLTMHINVTGACNEFEDNSENSYFTSLNIPLAVDTVEPMVTSSVTNGDSKVLACSSGINKNTFLIISIIFGALDVIAAAILVCFVYITRNEDINYAITVRKIFKNYRSYIQQITNAFDTEGYQLLAVNTFNEMLSIRDTIQSPILMYENEDQTQTSFMIPTNTNILYVYDVKVENFDAIYAKKEEEDIIKEDIDAEVLEEVLATPDVNLEDIDFVEDNDVEVEEGVEVVGVVWPEKSSKNKVYRYDPNGLDLNNGDMVLVPTKDKAHNREVVRKAAVAHENHKIAPDALNHPLKKVIGVVKRRVENVLSSTDETK